MGMDDGRQDGNVIVVLEGFVERDIEGNEESITDVGASDRYPERISEGSNDVASDEYIVAITDGTLERRIVGIDVGKLDVVNVGIVVDVNVGTDDGRQDGNVIGVLEGFVERNIEGNEESITDGPTDVIWEGLPEGTVEGTDVDISLLEGIVEGINEDTGVGTSDESNDGSGFGVPDGYPERISEGSNDVASDENFVSVTNGTLERRIVGINVGNLEVINVDSGNNDGM